MFQENEQYIRTCKPLAKKEDVLELRYFNDWDLLIIFKNGDKYLYDTYRNQYEILKYDNVNELSHVEECQEFSRRLKCIMERRKITQTELADKLGTTQTLISNYINGKNIPSTLMLRKISKILNYPMDEFYYLKY